MTRDLILSLDTAADVEKIFFIPKANIVIIGFVYHIGPVKQKKKKNSVKLQLFSYPSV